MHLYICFTNRRLINTLDMFYKAILWQFCCILSTTSRLELIFLLPWRIGSSNPGLGGIVNSLNCSLWVRVDCESNAIQAHLITAGSARLQVRPIREAVQPWKIIWGAHKKGNGNRDPMLRVIVPSTREHKDERKTAADQWKSKKSEKNDRWHE